MVRPKKNRCVGLTLLELLVAMSIVGVLAAVLLPAVQRMRETSRAKTCLNNLRQLGLGVQNFVSANQHLPHGTEIGYGTSWTARVLPFCEQQALYNSIDLSDRGPEFDRYWNDDDRNEEACTKSVPLFLCPSETAPSNVLISSGINDRGIVSYLGVATGTENDLRNLKLDTDFTTAKDVRERRNGVLTVTQANDPTWDRDDPGVITQINMAAISDGTSSTLMIGETIFNVGEIPGGTRGSSYGMDHWIIGSPNIDATGSDLSEHVGTTAVPLNLYHQITSSEWSTMTVRDRSDLARQMSVGYGSYHGSIVHFVYADGHVEAIDDTIDEKLRRQLGTRNDGTSLSR